MALRGIEGEGVLGPLEELIEVKDESDPVWEPLEDAMDGMGGEANPDEYAWPGGSRGWECRLAVFIQEKRLRAHWTGREGVLFKESQPSLLSKGLWIRYNNALEGEYTDHTFGEQTIGIHADGQSIGVNPWQEMHHKSKCNETRFSRTRIAPLAAGTEVKIL
jgi:hypothetical protein